MVSRCQGGAILAGWCAIVGCTPSFAATPCSHDDDCPSGFTCSEVDGYCIGRAGALDAAAFDAGRADTAALDALRTDAAPLDVPGTDTGPRDALRTDTAPLDALRTDASSGDRSSRDQNGPPSCGTVLSLHESFDDGVATDMWPYPQDGSRTSETANHLELAISSGVYAGYYARYPTDLHGNALRIGLVQAATATTAQAIFSLEVDADNFVSIYQEGAGITVHTAVGGVGDEVPFGPFDSDLHRWWQMRDDRGTLVFETSPDLTSWTTRHTMPMPAFAAHGHVDISAGIWGAGGPDTVVFTGLNQGLGSAPWCPANSLTDGFSGTSVDDRWFVDADPDCVAEVSAGILHLRSLERGTACSVETTAAYRLDDSEFAVELTAAPAATGVFSGVYISGAYPFLWWEFGREGDWLQVAGQGDGLSHFESMPVAIGSYRWLRVRRSGSTLFFEARTAGTAAPWDLVAQTDAATSFAKVTLGLMINPWSPPTNVQGPFEARFDHFNLPP